jgi:hemoglobin
MNNQFDTGTALRDIETADDIESLVDAFYAQALEDPVIGFYFTDVAGIDLDAHLPKLYRFWSAIILGLPTYRQNAFLPHAALNEKSPFEARHFARWLKLFFATIDSNFEGPKAEKAKSRAQQIATAMASKLVASENTPLGTAYRDN